MTDMQKVEKPTDILEITVNKERREILMSAGLIRRLASIIDGYENTANIFIDPILQTVLMIEALKPRAAHGTPVEKDRVYTLDDFDMSNEDGSKMVSWIGGHVLYFFIEGARHISENVVPQVKAAEEEIQTLTSSVSGTKSSLNETQSVGDMIGQEIKP